MRFASRIVRIVRLLSGGRILATKSKSPRARRMHYSPLSNSKCFSEVAKDFIATSPDHNSRDVITPEIVEHICEPRRSIASSNSIVYSLIETWRISKTPKLTRLNREPLTNFPFYERERESLSRNPSNNQRRSALASGHRAESQALLPVDQTRTQLPVDSCHQISLIVEKSTMLLVKREGVSGFPAPVSCGLALWIRGKRIVTVGFFAKRQRMHTNKPVKEDPVTDILSFVLMLFIVVWACISVLDKHSRANQRTHRFDTRSSYMEGKTAELSPDSVTKSDSERSLRKPLRTGNTIRFPVSFRLLSEIRRPRSTYLGDVYPALLEGPGFVEAAAGSAALDPTLCVTLLLNEL
jgi:hypothetical protein